jgi:uncharacterized protein (DUF885 family)
MKDHSMTARSGLAASLLTLALATAGCAAGPTTASAPATSPAQAAPAASERLRALFAASDEASLQRNPLSALVRGDARYAGRFGDMISEEYFAAEREAAETDLAALAAIDRGALSADEQVSYDMFKWQRSLDLRGLQPEMLALTAVRPIDHFNGAHTWFSELSSGGGAAPFKTTADYEAGLTRIDGFVTYLDRSIGRMREGLASGVVQPRLVMANVVEQLDALIAEGVEGSSFYKPVTQFPAAVPAADQARLKAAYAQTVRGKLLPALTRLRDFIRTDYLPRARESVGMREMKGGEALYRYLVEQNTTTTMTPDEIHDIGLRNVARIHAEMEKVKAQVGFKGTLQQFFEHIRTDPRFKPKSREWLQTQYVAVGKQVEANVGKLFSTLPKSPLDIRPVPALTEKGAARGSYQSGTPDGSRPGVFYFNAYDLPSRSTPAITTLYLHEGAPGHHFQISLAQENERLPAFQRFGGPNAFTEGWGLYSESLGRELGVLDDPYQYFGYLDSELFRAIRLVVDTGIHSKGWSRDRSIQYILDNSSRGRSNAIAETERYIANPGQALSYMVGALKIRELRTRAEAALGPSFDPRDFHAQVLMTGALPLAVLEAKIDRWIADRKGG